jgi:hypothetical protein
MGLSLSYHQAWSLSKLVQVNAYILKHLVDNGKLRKPLPYQKKTITAWMRPVK